MTTIFSPLRRFHKSRQCRNHLFSVEGTNAPSAADTVVAYPEVDDIQRVEIEHPKGKMRPWSRVLLTYKAYFARLDRSV